MALSSDNSARSIDHLVFPTADLQCARERLSALGFTVAADALHPFGTKNACVFFADGTYLEPLAVAQRETYEAAARGGNVFLARDLAYRFRSGDEGFSAVALKTDNAASDRERFVERGISAGDNLTFSRPFQDEGGKVVEASFELAFAADLRSPDCFFFSVQRLVPLTTDRTGLEKHANGCVGLRQLILTERNPSDFQYLLQDLMGQREVNAHSFGLEIMAGNAGICVLNSAGLKGFFGIERNLEERGLRLQGVVLATRRFDHLPEWFESNNVVYRSHGRRLIVPSAPGQGGVVVFEAE